MKRKLFIIIPIFLTLILFIFIKIESNKNIEKFYLEDKYYESNSFIKIDSNIYNNIKKESYILFTYNNYCKFNIPCEDIFESFFKENNVVILSIPFAEFKKIDLYKKIKYAPSVIIVKNGHIVAYLDAESDNDLDKYQDVSKFREWVSNYIYLTKED